MKIFTILNLNYINVFKTIIEFMYILTIEILTVGWIIITHVVLSLQCFNNIENIPSKNRMEHDCEE